MIILLSLFLKKYLLINEINKTAATPNPIYTACHKVPALKEFKKLYLDVRIAVFADVKDIKYGFSAGVNNKLDHSCTPWQNVFGHNFGKYLSCKAQN